MQSRDNHDRVLYADWKVQEFRSVQRFSDYRKITARLHQGGIIPIARQPKQRIWVSDHWLTIISTATGIILVLLAVVSILLTLQVM
jgi:hypothetical protein